MPLKEATTICKTILRNGYDAYIISAALQQELFERTKIQEVDIACEPGFETLSKLFPNLEAGDSKGVLAVYRSEDTGFLYRFYSTDTSDCSHPEAMVIRITDHMLLRFKETNEDQYAALARISEFLNSERVIEDVRCGTIKLAGIPQLTLRRNYVLGIRALRMAANFELPIDPNTWVAIVQSANRIIDYVPASEFVAEWRQVAAENMWRFIELLQESAILSGLIPEIAALSAIKQNKGKNVLEEESIFAHTINCMRFYPEEKLHHDWIGVVAVLFHEVGKLYTAEQFEGRWTFYQQHRVGAKVTRKILRRLHFDSEDIDTICGIVRNHLRFQSMMTDRGIRRFLALPETERLIELARAQIKAQANGNYTNFNHNIKYMSRADTPVTMVEPLLNGNEIMEYTMLPPGPNVGLIREALLNAQILGQVKTTEDAMSFVKDYKTKLDQ